MVKWESNLKKVFNQENLEIKRKGIRINGYGNGDLLVHVNVWHLKHWIKIKNNFLKNMTDENFIQILKKQINHFEKVKDMFSIEELSKIK
jgi:molecular chaperone DnaJ